MAAFEAGAVTVDISPDDEWFRVRRRNMLQMSHDLYYRTNSFTEGVAEPVWIRTLITRQNDKMMVLITADLIAIQPWLSAWVRAELGRKWGLENTQIAVTCSHAHSTPPYTENEPYGKWIAEQMVASVQAAIANLEPARIGATHGFCNNLSYYERIPITSENAAQLGAVPSHIGGIKHSRDYIEARAAAGPIDPQVGVVRIDHADGTPKAVLVHFTAHPAIEIEPPHVSPDYVGFAMKKIQRKLPGVVPLFCQGADGAININNMFGTLKHAKKHGETLANEVLRVLDSIETTDRVEAAYASRLSHLEFSPIPAQENLDEELAACQTYVENLKDHPDDVWVGHGSYTINLPSGFPPEARRRMVEVRIKQLEQARSQAGRQFPPLPVELQLFRWNDIALIFNPFELFVQPGLEVKRLSPYRYTFPVCYTGDCVGYVGPASEIARGGYHFTYFKPGRYALGNAERFVKEMITLVKGL